MTGNNRAKTAIFLAAAVLLLLSNSIAVSGAGIVVKASLERSEVRLGEQLALSIEVLGSSEATAPRLGDIEGLSVGYVGPSTQISIIQGKVSRAVTYRYRLTAERAGDFTLGPFVVEVAGAKYRTNSLQLRVLRPGAVRVRTQADRGGRGELFLELVIPSHDVFLHQRVPLEVTLYVSRRRIEEIEFPTLAGDGFSLEQFAQPVRGEKLINGKKYQTMRFDSTLVPQRTGRLLVGPASMKMAVVVRRRGWDDLLGGLWGGDPFAQRRALELHSRPSEIEVVSLPEAGRPTNFSGAVGSFEFSLTAKPLKVRVGDPVTVSIHISGRGNLAGLSPPEVRGEYFKSYPPRSLKEEEKTGARVFEQAVIPTSAEAHEIPSVSFSYFDPEARRYKTLISAPLPLTLLPATQVAGGEKPPVVADESDAIVGHDIVYIKEFPGTLLPVGYRPYRRPLLWVVCSIPLAIFLGVSLLVRRKERLSSDPTYARYVRAGVEVRRRLREAAGRVGQGDGAVYEQIGHAVRDYLSAKLDLPPGAIDPKRVVASAGSNGAVIESHLEELFSLIERVRYGREGGGEEGERRALELARGLVKKLEKDRELRRRMCSRAVAAAVIGTLLSMTTVGFASSLGVAKEAFFSGNAHYREGRYDQAVASYLKVLESGAESASLHYNLGNSYFKIGKLGLAIASYERARRLAPRDPDIGANLEFARSALKSKGEFAPLVPLSLRLVFPLAFLASSRELMACASASYLFLMGILVARLLFPRGRQMLSRACVAAALLLAVSAASLATRVVQEDLKQRAVVIQETSAPVRFEPSETGTVHFKVSEGVLLTVVRERPGWLQVRRADGMRGWIDARAVEII